MEGGLNPNIGLDNIGAGVQPPTPQESTGGYKPYAGSGGGISPLEAGLQSSYAGLSEASKLFFEHAPPAKMLEAVGLLDTKEVVQELDNAAKGAYNEFKKYRPAIASYKDIESAGDTVEYIGDTLAMGIPQIASLFLGPTGLALLAMEATGSTILQQEEAGEEKNVGRAVATGAIEAALNTPISKAARGIFASISKSGLDEVAKKNLGADLIKGIGMDVGLNGLQQITRNYGVEGKFSTKHLDEALVGGLLVSTPLRGAKAITSKALKDRVVERASDTAATSGDIKAADGFLNKTISFLAGEAMRPVRRIANTKAGNALLESINNMRHDRENITGELNSRVTELFGGVKDKDAFISAYSRGERNTPQLVELSNILNEVHARANRADGANLNIGHIENFLPTLFDPKTVTADTIRNMKIDYANWFIQNKGALRAAALRAGKDPNDIITPLKSEKIFDEWHKALTSEEVKAPELPRVRIDNAGNIISAGSPIQTRSVRREDSLDFSRMLGFVPQEILTQYAVKASMPEQIKQYVFGAAQRITYAEQMGKNNEKLNLRVAEAGQELKNVNKPFNMEEINTIYNSMDAYQGLYNQFKDATGRKWATRARVVTNMFALPLTSLSSLTEPFNLSIKVGNVEAARAFTSSLRTISRDLMSHFTNGWVPKSEVGKQLAMADRGFRNATTALNNRLNGDYASSLNTNGIRGIKSLTAINNVYFHITGQTMINYLVNSMAAHAANSQVRNDLMIVNGYKGSKLAQEATARLNAVGINSSQFNGLHTNPSMLSKQMPGVVARFNKDVALDPGALDKPLWMSTGWGAMFSQLRGYPTMFTNTVLPKFIKLFDPRGKSASDITAESLQAITSIGMILSFGFLQESLKNDIKGGTSTEEEILTKAIRNTLTPIHMGYLMDALSGNMSKNITPAAASISETYIKRVHKGEDIKLEDLPFLNSVKGLL